MANLLDTITGAASSATSTLEDAKKTIDQVRIGVFVLAAAELVILIILLRRK